MAKVEEEVNELPMTIGKAVEELPWLIPFLEAKFYERCIIHCHINETRYCLECLGSPFCGNCYTETRNHIGHPVLQVNRSGSQSVIRVESISKYLDLTGIHQHTQFSKNHVFIRTRPPHILLRSLCGSLCISCGLRLDTDRTATFCSLQCAVKHELDLVVASMTTARENSGDSASVRKNEQRLLDLNEPFVTEEKDDISASEASLSTASEQTGNTQKKKELALPDLNEPVDSEEDIDSVYMSNASGFGTDWKYSKKKRRHP